MYILKTKRNTQNYYQIDHLNIKKTNRILKRSHFGVG